MSPVRLLQDVHSKNVCIFTKDAEFTGDTLLNNTKIPLTFPHSNHKDYANSIQKIKPLLKPGMTIYPGHGESFVVDEPILQQFGI
jgi:glyoxylase-like metal-dependent hydrolase (beta-lactamase superfamily II)